MWFCGSQFRSFGAFSSFLPRGLKWTIKTSGKVSVEMRTAETRLEFEKKFAFDQREGEGVGHLKVVDLLYDGTPQQGATLL